MEALRWHQLVEPVRNLQERVCTKTSGFCREERRCICPACPRDEHPAVSIETEAQERRTQREVLRKEVEKLLSEKDAAVESFRRSPKQSRQEGGEQSRERQGLSVSGGFVGVQQEQAGEAAGGEAESYRAAG